MYQNHLEGFLRHRFLGFAIRVSDLVVAEWVQGNCISCNFQRDADTDADADANANASADTDAAGLWTHSMFHCSVWHGLLGEGWGQM